MVSRYGGWAWRVSQWKTLQICSSTIRTDLFVCVFYKRVRANKHDCNRALLANLTEGNDLSLIKGGQIIPSSSKIFMSPISANVVNDEHLLGQVSSKTHWFPRSQNFISNLTYSVNIVPSCYLIFVGFLS